MDLSSPCISLFKYKPKIFNHLYKTNDKFFCFTYGKVHCELSSSAPRNLLRERLNFKLIPKKQTFTRKFFSMDFLLHIFHL